MESGAPHVVCASSSVLHERFQTWQTQGVWERIFAAWVRFYRRGARHPVALAGGGQSLVRCATGRQRTGQEPDEPCQAGLRESISWSISGAAPLAIDISGANQHDKWWFHALVVHVAVKRPTSHQHFCGDKGYDFDDVRQTVAQAGYVPHIKRNTAR